MPLAPKGFNSLGEMTRVVEQLMADGRGRAGEDLIPFAVPADEIVDGRVVPGVNRSEPVCPHFESCGGCLFQHVADGFLSDWKAATILRLLRDIGVELPLRRIHRSPERSRRRATFSARRTKKTVILGYHAKGTDQIVGISTCPLVVPAIEDALPVLRDLTRLAASRSSEVKFHVTQTDTGLDLVVSGARPLRPEDAGHVSGLPFARITWNDDLVAMQEQPEVRFAGIPVGLPPGAFLQATQDGEAALQSAVLDAVGDADEVADLFCGCGTFALPLAARAQVSAMESDASMVAALDKAWRRASGLRAVTAQRRDLFRRPVAASELRKFSAVVLDPPRAGAAAQIAQIAGSGVPVVAYVSCNPASFARDAAVLVKAGYQLDWLEMIDQFRWSAHTELAARFSL